MLHFLKSCINLVIKVIRSFCSINYYDYEQSTHSCFNIVILHAFILLTNLLDGLVYDMMQFAQNFVCKIVCAQKVDDAF